VKDPSKESPGGMKSLLNRKLPRLELAIRTSSQEQRPLKHHLSLAASGECCANNSLNFGIQIGASVTIMAIAFGDDTHHGHVNFIVRSQMIQRSTNYQIKMAALVICQVSVLTVLVWMFH
jgi:hypothetical protein